MFSAARGELVEDVVGRGIAEDEGESRETDESLHGVCGVRSVKSGGVVSDLKLDR